MESEVCANPCMFGVTQVACTPIVAVCVPSQRRGRVTKASPRRAQCWGLCDAACSSKQPHCCMLHLEKAIRTREPDACRPKMLSTCACCRVVDCVVRARYCSCLCRLHCCWSYHRCRCSIAASGALFLVPESAPDRVSGTRE